MEESVMKRIFISLAAIAVFVACSRETVEGPAASISSISGNQFTVKASIAALDPSSKTSYAGEKTFSWEANDEALIQTVDNAGNSTFVKMTAESAGAETNFIGTLPEGASLGSWAVYPSTLNPSVEAGTLSITLPTTYTEGSNPLSIIPLVGVADGNRFTFSTAVSVLKFTLTNLPAEASRLRLWSKTNQPLSGTFTYSVSDKGVTLTSGTDAVPYVDLGFTRESAGTATFYIPVPVGSISAGLEISVSALSTNGFPIELFSKVTTAETPAPRNTIVGLKSVEVKPWYLETVAGTSVAGSAQNTGLKATFASPQRITLGPDGKTAFLVQRSGNMGLRSIDLDNYAVKNLRMAGDNVDGVNYSTIMKNYPWGLAFDGSGDLWIASKGTNTGYTGATLVHVPMGDGKYAATTKVIEGLASTLKNFMDVQFDANDNLYLVSRDVPTIFQIKDDKVQNSWALTGSGMIETMIMDQNKEKLILGASGSPYAIRIFDPQEGTAEIVAGKGETPTASNYSDGLPGNTLEATIGSIEGMFCDTNGTVYFLDIHSRALRCLVPDADGDYTKGCVKTLAGTPLQKAENSTAQQNAMACKSLFCDNFGGIIRYQDSFIIVESTNGNRIRRLYK